MTRRVTFTCDVPEELYRAAEQKASAESRRVEDVVMEYLVRHQRPRPAITEAEAQRRKQAFERHFGRFSGDAHASENEGIDADLVREYQGKQEQ